MQTDCCRLVRDFSTGKVNGCLMECPAKSEKYKTKKKNNNYLSCIWQLAIATYLSLCCMSNTPSNAQYRPTGHQHVFRHFKVVGSACLNEL